MTQKLKVSHLTRHPDDEFHLVGGRVAFVKLGARTPSALWSIEPPRAPMPDDYDGPLNSWFDDDGTAPLPTATRAARGPGHPLWCGPPTSPAESNSCTEPHAGSNYVTSYPSSAQSGPRFTARKVFGLDLPLPSDSPVSSDGSQDRYRPTDPATRQRSCESPMSRDSMALKDQLQMLYDRVVRLEWENDDLRYKNDKLSEVKADLRTSRDWQRAATKQKCEAKNAAVSLLRASTTESVKTERRLATAERQLEAALADVAALKAHTAWLFDGIGELRSRLEGGTTNHARSTRQMAPWQQTTTQSHHSSGDAGTR
ncbi:hypothetical protein Q5752_006007 [Cryptotrichosporon argae]